MGCWLACDSRHLILFSCSLSPPTYLAIKSTLESRAGRRCDTSMAHHKGEPACPNCFLGLCRLLPLRYSPFNLDLGSVYRYGTLLCPPRD